MAVQDMGGEGLETMEQRRPCGEGRRVLVAEDDEYMRTLVAMLLRIDGFEVIEAKNGAELFDQVAPWLDHPPGWTPPDVVISDIKMPQINGIEVLAALAGADNVPPIILISALCDQETREQATHYGAAALLNKPFDLAELRALVANLVMENAAQ